MPIFFSGTPLALARLPQNDFYILDLEYTSWQGAAERCWGGSEEYREIVEIGILKCTFSGKKIVVSDHFSKLVVPKINPVLSSYFCELTGIKQNNIEDEGRAFDEVEPEVANFLSTVEAQILVNGNDLHVLKDNYFLNNIEFPEYFSRVFDFSRFLQKITGFKREVLYSANLRNLFPLKDRADLTSVPIEEHRALADCYSILHFIIFCFKNEQIS